VASGWRHSSPVSAEVVVAPKSETQNIKIDDPSHPRGQRVAVKGGKYLECERIWEAAAGKRHGMIDLEAENELSNRNGVAEQKLKTLHGRLGGKGSSRNELYRSEGETKRRWPPTPVSKRGALSVN